MRRKLIAAWLITLLPLSAKAADSAPHFHYPELMVVPSASESVARYSQQASPSMLAFQIPASLNLLAGIIMFSENPGDRYHDPYNKERHRNSAITASVVSAAWLGISFGLNQWYNPYSKAWRELEALPAKTDRERLIRERLAEQEMAAASRLGKILTHASAASQAIMTLVILSSTNSDMPKVLAGLAGITAFSPYIFQLPWISNYDQHRLYKKRIYGPIAGISLDTQADRPRLNQLIGYQILF